MHESISDIAHAYQVSARTLRYYEELGMLSPQRLEGKRVYTSREKTRLTLILRGKKYGFTLQQIREMIQLFDQDPTGVQQLEATIKYGQEKIEEMDQRIEELQELRTEMNGWLAKFRDELKSRKRESI
ncbi:MerR family DNA-binding transcriptional regulator [Halobacillus sp. Marseille-P3879]|uniref:MerR family transcriptional regulator n=1 Tax=Halobacillus sp. Marseille-P3879 TaxID=2045014 RepID=UPI000C7A443E|nr:MerR family DNA-binding transcriptional regulator [Halobacillus sp. Marseille-P3879]